jgi:hypothetical protein
VIGGTLTLIEARDGKHLLRFQKQLASYELSIVDENMHLPQLKRSGWYQ